MGRVAAPRRPSWPALVWLALLVLAVAAGGFLAVNSDAANTDVRTEAAAPKSPDRPLSERLRPLWSTRRAVDDRRAGASNTVITTSQNGVRALDPRTGEERWHYLRSTAALCDLTVLDDVVVAIFRTTGRCNEVVALEAGTGVRRWYRNVDFAARLRLSGSGTAAVAANPGGIAVLDAVGNSIRWGYSPPRGCELSSIAVGINAVVALERCTTGTTWLASFELYSGHPQWRVPPPAGEITVLGADGVVSLLAGQQLLILSAGNGKTLSTEDVSTEDAAGAAVADAATATATITGEFGPRTIPLVHVGDRLYAVDPATGVRLWSVVASGLPAVTDLGLVVPEAESFVIRNPVTGAEITRSMPVADSSAPEEGLGNSALARVVRVELVGSILIAVTEGGVTAYG